MSKTLVLAEKPSVGRELARVLNAKNKQNGYYEGSDHIVTWSLGHLIGLADPESYGEKYQKWSLETLPMLPDKMNLVILPATSKQYHTVAKLLRRKDVSSIVIATDAGREGELVARWIIKHAKVNKPTKRLWISSQTDGAIRAGFKSLKPASDYDHLAKSAQSRAEADWVVGLNITRALTCRFNAQLSAGRVQTPTLAMIDQREEMIARFKSQTFYTIKAHVNGFALQFKNKAGGRIYDETEAKTLVNKLKNQTATITNVVCQEKAIPPPALYDLTTLQRDANAKYGLSAKETLKIMQALYEEHKLLTYPRTDSRYLSQDITKTLNMRLQALSSGRYGNVVKSILQDKKSLAKTCINDAKVSDHHAIIPTEERAGSAHLSSDEWKIYALVVERFLGNFLGASTYESTVITAQIASETFGARGNRELTSGWRLVSRDMDMEMKKQEENEEEEEQSLPLIRKGDQHKVISVNLHDGRTKPPRRFTEGTLLAAMENPQAFVEDKHHKSVLQETGGIGTPATRADIIEKLFQTYYIEKEGNYLLPTSKGKQLISLVPNELCSPVLTAQWEERLRAISLGKEKPEQFNSDMRQFAKDLVKSVKTIDAIYKHDNLTNIACPSCGKLLLDVNGKRGKMRVCQDRNCGYRETVSTQSNARCPNCHKKLSIIGKDEKRLYACNTCGFREKYDRFNKKLADKRDRSGKQDVKRFMDKQKKENNIGANAFADAWSKAMQEGEK